MEIVLYPDPVLEQEGALITVFDDELREKVCLMFETMYAARGVGLAAPQVGWSAKLFVVNPTGGEDPEQDLVFINPQIVSKAGRKIAEEGCLSFPDMTVHVPRAVRILAQAQDLAGNRFEMRLEDLPARIIQHEYDHVMGILFITKMMPADRIAVDKKLKDLRARVKAS